MIHVAIGIVMNTKREVLIAKRPPESLGGGKWEFPGGKLETGEASADALVREFQEEVGLCVTDQTLFTTYRYTYPDRVLNIDVWRILTYTGIAHGREGQHIAWVSIDALHEWDMLPANETVIELLRTESP